MKLGPNQQAWVDALRSGEYAKGKGHLKKDGTFCCLGVATDVLGVKRGLGEWQLATDYAGTMDVYVYEGDADVCPTSILNALRMHTCVGEISPFTDPPMVVKGDDYFELTTINDDSDLSFSGIADIIELRADMLFEGPA